MIGTDFLIIILLWCGDPAGTRTLYLEQRVHQCRREKITCVSKLKNFTTDDVVNKCLLGGR